MEFSDQEVRNLANRIAEIIYPQLEEAIKSKAKWQVKELSKLSGEYRSVKEVAKMFSVDITSVHKMIERGLPHVWFGGSLRIETSIIKQAIDEGTFEGALK